MRFVFPVFLIIYGIMNILSLFVKFPGMLNIIFDTNRIPGIFIFLPEHIRVPVSKVIVGGCAVGLGIFLMVVLV
ncbi:MAG: hypothetical protein APR63_00790 [Desulfuromonas sp. SDB]|nr:MAG: hypothetical protein APR63_00790 [Desulfuromonas sp. SDB]